MAAGGPMTPDNPYAVAFAFWHAALNENYDDLELLVTPESQDNGILLISALEPRIVASRPVYTNPGTTSRM
jgi:hypothetical protein